MKPRTRRRVVLLGATGSIGQQACNIIERYPDTFELVGIAAGSDIDALNAVAQKFNVTRCAVMNMPEERSAPVGWGVGVNAVCDIAGLDADVVCIGISGAAALQPTLSALEKGTDIAVATKEVLVMAGELVREVAQRTGARIIPVDSEHSALWQCLRGEDPETVTRLILTASGGPFRERDGATLRSVTPQEALQHPNWTMGPKITIDSATMMNKGLEVIEAHFLFGVPYERIDVVVHPSSIVHSAVEFCDGAVIAQMGMPDMRIPIALALSGGERLPGVCSAPQLDRHSPLEFIAVDEGKFPAVELARKTGEQGGVAPCAMSAANEAAVDLFLREQCRFDEIVPLVADVVSRVKLVGTPSLDDVMNIDRWARDEVYAMVGSREGSVR